MLHNLLLLFVFFITCVGGLVLATENQEGFLSIDCGVEDEYLDHPTGIWFKSDKEFIGTGENHEIMPEYYSVNEQFGRRYKTLRSFPNGTKNCYTLKLEGAKNSSFRIRASFSYGNYDRQNQPPKFDLYLGVNYWATVEFNFTRLFYEIIYVFPTDTQYVCLVNTGSGSPLISSLEIRPSNVSTYGNGSSLENMRIYDVNSGLGQQFGVRYKDDIYDRIWYPYRLPNSVPVSTTSDIDTRDGGNLYKLPVEVLRTAVQPPNGSNSMTGSFAYLSDYEYNVYFHFAELEDFEDKLREISITVNGILQGPFTLEYLKPLSKSFLNLRIEGEITFTIASTKESGLPPILNAFEIYQLTQFELSATNQSDVDAIMSTKHTYNIDRDDWQGDPCLPKETTWTGLSCRFDTTPRIISLNLSSSKLTGEISPSLALLQEIESIDLSYNELTGYVPDVLARLPKLKVLNLSGNKLKGPIPQSLQEKSDNGSLLLSFIEDQNSCQMDPCEGNSKKFIVPLVISIVAAVALVTLLSVLIIFHRKKWRKQTEVVNSTASNKKELLKSKNRPFTYSEIATITANFKTEIGDGGFGKVFLGHLNDGTPVAVKLLSSSSKQGYKEFQAEAQSLMIVHHKNLVSLIGYCKEDDHMALVYEFMANGNLRQHLSETKEAVLNWKQRLQVAVDAAQGLDYLHNGCKPPVVHRDLKPSNILLNEKMQAKIADFGLSRFFSTENASHILTSCAAGTLGYVDPEFHGTGNLNKKIDVYSFGIILFELITGQPVILRSTEFSIHITEWVRPMIEKGDIRMIVDPRLENEFDVNAAWKAVEIAMSCALQTSKQRPDISHVLAELKECLGRNDQSVLTETTSLEMDSDMLPVAR
ncbi:hypothetical protein like AT4G29990 [Hibiscus trionum]|uniref:non-specific serine/threonine protein kinase n=1 Tax=Hibiscus trionum TaxID=183268 RepID=A0A9W7HLB6_HIBTR|nr:hypothetical protein like AT4G29990 [Hibiscus trionum]